MNAAHPAAPAAGGMDKPATLLPPRCRMRGSARRLKSSGYERTTDPAHRWMGTVHFLNLPTGEAAKRPTALLNAAPR